MSYVTESEVQIVRTGNEDKYLSSICLCNLLSTDFTEVDTIEGPHILLPLIRPKRVSLSRKRLTPDQLSTTPRTGGISG
jgi:hypothetical protein